jgi:outer membrane protein with beta-barrel domain
MEQTSRRFPVILPLATLIRSLTIAAALFGVGLVLAGPAGAANKKHHLGLALGYERLLSSDFNGGSGNDFRSNGYGASQYRFSLQQNLDLTMDFRGLTHSESSGGEKVTLTNTYWGPGIRLISPNEGTRPYVQANFLLVREEVKDEISNVTISAHENGAGFGICGGVDIRAGNLLSIPIEANYMYGKPSDDISGVGINAGVTFNFGELNK